MKKIIFILSIFLSLNSFSQIVFQAISPSTIANNYQFTWADPMNSSGWSTPNFFLPSTFIQDTLVIVEDGSFGTNAQGHPISQEGCNSLINNVNGKIAVVYRNTCDFSTKALNAQNAGAVGVIIINRDPTVLTMSAGSQGGSVYIPVVMLSSIDGETLVNEMQNGPAVVFMGNKNGFFDNDVALSANTALAPKGGMIHSLLAQNGTEFNFEVGAKITNPGNQTQNNVSLNAKVTNPSGVVVYNNTVSGISISSGDLTGFEVLPGGAFNFPSFILNSYPIGTYKLTYTADIGGNDQFIFDNVLEFKFTINDSIFSFSTIDASINTLESSKFDKPFNAPPPYSQCTVIYDPNASRVFATGLYFSAVTEANSGISLNGEAMGLHLYQWDDQFSGLNDPNLDYNLLTEVVSGLYYYTSDLQGDIVYGSFDNPVALLDNKRYLACVQTNNTDIYFGYGNQNYTMNTDYYQQPLFPIESNGTYYALGFGGNSPSSLGVKLEGCPPSTNQTLVVSSCTPYVSPTNQTYLQSGIYSEVIPNVVGCDSVYLTINLSFPDQIPTISSDITSSYCETPTGSIILSSSPITGNSPYISECYNGIGNDKFVEIYNPTDFTFVFGNQALQGSSGYIIQNASGTAYMNLPNCCLGAHSTMVINLDESYFDGSGILLRYLSYPEAIDLVTDAVLPINNRTLLRKISVLSGSPSIFDPNEWIDTTLFFNTLGKHDRSFEYVFNWSNGSYNDSLMNVFSGNYSYNLVHISSGCVVHSETITVPNTGNNFNPTFSSANQLYTAPPFAVQFINSTANPSNYSFTWDFGDGTTLASNNASVFHQYLYNGQYTVSLIATSNTTGCSDTTTLSDYIFCTGGVSCTHTAAISQTSPQQACQGVPLWLTCNNDPSFTYQWRRNGVTIPGNNNDSLAVTQSGTYYVAILVNNCPVNSNDVVVNLLTAPSTPIITSSGAIQPCVGGSVTLNAGNYTTYNWSTGATTQSINVTSSGTYSVSVTGANGCSSSSAPFNVNASFVAPPQVCIVGMDSLTNENRIVWEKPLTLGIDSFYVYKESNVSNVYTKIGATDYNQLAVFLDANSNPAVQAYRYKISALDTCGVETNVGDFHKTIHLTINQGVGNSWNLIWSHYEGLTFGSYRIYRGTSLSNMALLTTIQSNLNSYTDLTPPTGPLYYQIEVVNPNNCDPTKIMNYGLSKSNIVDNGVIGISEEVLSTINVYPNPTNDKFTLNVSNDLLGKGYVITDFSGRIISKGKINSLIQIIDIQEIAKGSYFLQIDKSTAKAIKIIKQ